MTRRFGSIRSVDGSVAVTSSLGLGLVLGRGVGVDALGVVVRLKDVLQGDRVTIYMSKSVLAEYLLGVGLMLGPWVSSNLLRLLVGLLLLLLIGWLLVCRPLWLLRLLEGLLLEGGLLVGGLDRLLGSWLEVSLLSSWLLLDRGRPMLLNLESILLMLSKKCCSPTHYQVW